MLPGFRCLVEGITSTVSSYGADHTVSPSRAIGMPAFGTIPNPSIGTTNSKFIDFATTGSVTRITRCRAGGSTFSLDRIESNGTLPVAARKRSIVSTATSTADFSQCWPHSISTAVRGLAGSLKLPRSRMRTPARMAGIEQQIGRHPDLARELDVLVDHAAHHDRPTRLVHRVNVEQKVGGVDERLQLARAAQLDRIARAE